MAAADEAQLWRQYVIAAIVNIGILCTGYCIGWSSPVHLILTNVTTSPLGYVITTDQEAWMGSLFAVGTIFGPFIAGFAVSNIGRKGGLISCSIPFLIGWILIIITSNVDMIYAGRIFWGLGAGMMFTVSPMYCAEIATDDSRGALGSYLELFSGIGVLLVYVIGPFVSYGVNAYVGLLFTVLFTVGVFIMPESPIYYLTKNNKQAAIESLAIIRGCTQKDVMDEIDKMNAEVIRSRERTVTSVADIFRGNNFKALYISCVLMVFQQFTGIDAVVFYLTIIFEATGASLEPSIATIIVGVVMVGASFITPFVVDRLGRRFLLLISTSGTAIAQGLLGMFFLLADKKMPVVATLGFLPVLSLVLFIVSYALGIGPVPFAIMSELLPIETKTIVSPIATTLNWVLMFIITRFFSSITEAVGMGATFLMFGAFCVLAFFFTLFFVPETKGKSFQEIQEMLAGKFFSSITEAVGMGATFLMFGAFCVLAFFFTLFFVPETKGKSFQEIQEMLADNLCNGTSE